MKQGRVISLGKYKAQRLSESKRLSQAAVQKSLPGADRLWELLDRNIGISVWHAGN